MTAPRPGDKPRRFGPDELAGVPGINPEELAAETRLARDLEAVASRGGMAPSPDFADRVMAAVATEPVPAPAIAAGSALRRGALTGFLASVRDAFRVAFGGGFPVAARAQAFALVLLVAAVATGSGLVTAGALGAFEDHASPSPVPSLEAPEPTTSPAPSDTPTATFPQPTPSPYGSLEPAESASAETAEPSDSPEPGETGEPGDDHGGGSGDDHGGSTGDSETPEPTDRATSRPTPEPTDDADETSTPHPTNTPDPTKSPSPSPSPDD